MNIAFPFGTILTSPVTDSACGCSAPCFYPDVIENNSGGSTTSGNSNLVPFKVSFKVGQTASLMNAGDTTLVLNYTNVLEESVLVFVSGPYIPEYDEETEAAGITAGVESTTITFNQGVSVGDRITITGLRKG
jgi:hypothetical protein